MIDTNVLISALFFDGLCEMVIQDVIDKKVEGYINEEIIKEYSYIVETFKQKSKTSLNSSLYTDFIPLLNFKEALSYDKISRDQDDDKFINCALDSGASYIISGDNDLLEIREYKGIKIMTPREYYELRIKLSDA